MTSEADFDIAGRSEAEIEEELAHTLRLKGYCVLDLGRSEDQLDEAYHEVRGIRMEDRFQVPPQEIVEGLLGDEGTSEMAWLTDPDDVADGNMLREISKDLSYMAGCARPFYASLGQPTDITASLPLLVRGGEVERADVLELTEESCSMWTRMFVDAKLLMIYFIGPDDGSLELQPLDDESDEVTIKTRPDMLVILRCDALTHRHISSKDDFAICQWILSPTPAVPRGMYNTEAEKKLPGVAELTNWVGRRLGELAVLDGREEMPADLSRPWQRLLRASYFQHQSVPVAIRGCGTHNASTWDYTGLWASMNHGADYIGQVPYIRWDHEKYYDADPLSYLSSQTWGGGVCKTSVKHFQSIDGIELFDLKFFGVSQSESTGMEPQQRHVLETCYEGLFQAGYTKKALMTKYIAVFTGCTHPEAAYIQYTQGAGAGNVSQAITSNRTSFMLGLMGPSSSIDVDMSGSHTALIVGASAVAPNHMHRHTTGGYSEASISSGVHFHLTPYLWPRFNVLMNPAGRSLTFDQAANGFVFGEACSSVCQKPFMDKIDGEWVKQDGYCLGTMVGWKTTSNGRTASMSAPHGPGIMEAASEAIKSVGIDVLDVDGIECHGVGGLLEDTVETSCMTSLLRYAPGSAEEPLVLGSCKSNIGAQNDACGMTQFIKVLMNIAYAVNIPNLHLKQLNPHFDLGEDGAVLFVNEHVAYRDTGVFHGLAARGNGGTNAHIISWHVPDKDKVYTATKQGDEGVFSYWPGGGGMLEKGASPSTGYSIAGSWNEWTPEEMEKEDGDHVFTVTLGPNRCETFQIWLDGESERALHPTAPRAPSATPVAGPSFADDVAGLSWMIDGRVTTFENFALGNGAAAITDSSAAAPEAEPSVLEVPNRDRGGPGDQYEVKVSVSGKYRSVSWKKVSSAESEEEVSRAFGQGKYYVVGSWSGYSPEEMTASGSGAPGCYTLEVGPFAMARNLTFQVMRNNDWEQLFYPAGEEGLSGGEASHAVDGPDELGGGRMWRITARSGDSFKIEFQRCLEGGAERRCVTWHPSLA